MRRPRAPSRGACRLPPPRTLRALALLEVEEPERPFLSRSLRVPGRLVAHLLGDDTPDASLTGRVRPLTLPATAGTPGDDTFTGRLATRLAEEPLTVYLREHREGEGLAHAARALPGGALHYTPRGTHADEPLAALVREARLRNLAVVVSALPDDPGALVRALSVPDVTVVFTGPRPYDPQWCDHDPLVLDAPGWARTRCAPGRPPCTPGTARITPPPGRTPSASTSPPPSPPTT